MEKTTLNIQEVIDFMKWKVKEGEVFSSNMVQRKFRTGYINARKAIEELELMGYVELNTSTNITYHRIK